MLLIAVGPAVVLADLRSTAASSATSSGPSLLAAVGLGFSFVPVTIAAVSGVEDARGGLASGLINTSQQVGGALGLAVLSTVAFTQIDDAATGDGRPAEPLGAHRRLRRRVHGRLGDRPARGAGDAAADPAPGQPGSRRPRRPDRHPRAESATAG